MLAIHVVHETAYPRRWFEQVWRLVRPGGRLIVSEPAGHVTCEDFSREQAMAEACGFIVEPLQGFRKARAMICQKPAKTAAERPQL